MRKSFLLLITLLCLTSIGFAQSKKKKTKEKEEVEKPDIRFKKADVDTMPDADLKKKRNYYYGEKTKKSFTAKDSRTAVTYELFNVLREPVKVDSYVRRIYYHDPRKGEVVAVTGRGQTLTRVLHGPYKRTVNDIVVEEGMYYYGTKHETWMYQKTDSTLYDKRHYVKGWFRDSEITYYDEDQKTRIKEVIPYRYGKKEGEYYLFFPSGNIAVRGRYEFDRKVGVWEEFHNLPGVSRIKKEIQYPPEFHLKNFKSYVRKEWNRNATPTYVAPLKNQ